VPSVKKTFSYGSHTVTLETGVIARQATAAVYVTMGDTHVLVTAVHRESTNPGQDFFPLTVNYQERTYAAGRIPGGYFKREGKPTEKETLTCRLIDRPIRPLFPRGYHDEVQIIATVMSLDPEIDSDIPALLGASAALCLAGLPFAGPLGAARVGYSDGQYLLNPDASVLATSQLDMVVAGTEKAVLMVESEAHELPESVMLGAVTFAHREMQAAVSAIKALVEESGVPEADFAEKEQDAGLVAKVGAVSADIAKAYQVRDKKERQQAVAGIRDRVLQEAVAGIPDVDQEAVGTALKNIFKNLERKTVRDQILSGAARIDGRDTKTVRPITIQTGLLPRAHGSVLFTRGETQAIVAATLGTERDAQTIDALAGEVRQSFMLHYNFPPYSVGETGFMSGPKRREIGHGYLARRGVEAILPKDFPYVLRVVSEITESNGSSSMATVCGTSLALMDAGVPLREHVAGIAMGLVKEGDRFAVLTDILGDEDHLGDMDFKVAGTRHGVTALQMDIKIDGITEEIMKAALTQALAARLHIIAIMEKALPQARPELSAFAPRIVTLKIPTDRIRDVIGKGGATIRALTEETGTVIDISDDGEVSVSAVDLAACEEAVRRIEQLTMDVSPGEIYEGVVVKLADFGAFVSILPGKQGLVHISQITKQRVERVSDHLSEGQTVRVKVIEVDRQGRIRLSMKEIEGEQTKALGGDL